MSLNTAPIPQAVAGTVAVADRQAFENHASGPVRLAQLAVLIPNPGAHTNFIVTIEGSNGSGTWINLAPSIMNPNLPGGIVISESGVTIPTVAIGQAGIAFIFSNLSYTAFRLGIAGDNVAPGGLAQLLIKQP